VNDIIQSDSAVDLYQQREKIFTRSVDGFFQRIRVYTGWPLLLGYFLCPWITIDGRPAIFFDLAERKFHIFWFTFWPQDFVFLGWALIIAAFLLFFITTLIGRVWCGYTCPQTVWTQMFMWAERITEGERHQRIKLDNATGSMQKYLKRTAKHAMWLVIAGVTGLTFVGYFYGIRPLIVDAVYVQLPLISVFWVFFFTIATYINAGWMREQVCLYMCPYARFQSAMFDNDTLIVSYDTARGEPRGARKKTTEFEAEGLGACVDCTYCVQVCPTGIDIRDGLQYQCINCALCVDACDSIMDKMGYDRGLIKYTTENALAGRPWTYKRFRLVGYGVAMVVMISLFGMALLVRVPLELDVMRSRGQLYQEMPNGMIQNIYTLKILNMDNNDHEFYLSVTGPDDVTISPDVTVRVAAGEIGEVSRSLAVHSDRLLSTNMPLEFVISSVDGELVASSQSRFLGPGLR
jgi:cytochrome c oxidase accessory protein FixG